MISSTPRAEVGAVDVGHGQVEGSVLLAGGERRHDVRVVEVRGELGLTEEPSAETLVARQLRRKKLHRDSSAGRRLLSQVDRSHRALAEERRQAKAGENCAGSDMKRHFVFTSLNWDQMKLKDAEERPRHAWKSSQLARRSFAQAPPPELSGTSPWP
jgi:hypothetical protein